MSGVGEAGKPSRETPVAPLSVLVADDDLYLTILHEPSSARLLEDRFAMVIPYSLTPAVNVDGALAVREMLERSGQSMRNTLLVKNPYRAASYEPADTALQAFASAKHRAVGQVAGLLGARTVEVVETRVDKTTLKHDARFSAVLKLLRADVDGSREVAEEIAKRLEVVVKFAGGAPRPEEARAYLAQRNLSADDELLDLINMRADTELLEYTMTVNGTRESRASLAAALDLAAVPVVKAAQVGVGFSQTLQAVSTVEISTRITF